MNGPHWKTPAARWAPSCRCATRHAATWPPLSSNPQPTAPNVTPERHRHESPDHCLCPLALPLCAQGRAGLAEELGGMTVNRFCGSSMSAIHIAAAQIEAGLGEAYLCIGVESMTMVPQGGFNFSPPPALYEHSDAYISMGETAENVAQRYAVTRADQEALAVASHRKAAAARDAGRLQAEIVPITPASGDMVAQDGCIRPGTTPEALAELRPAFRDDGVVTAG